LQNLLKENARILRLLLSKLGLEDEHSSTLVLAEENLGTVENSFYYF